MRLTWEAVSAICAVLTVLGAAIALYMKLLFAAFEGRLFKRMDDRYVNVDLAEERRREDLRRVHRLERHAGF